MSRRERVFTSGETPEAIGNAFGRWYGMYKREHPDTALLVLTNACIACINGRGTAAANRFLERVDR